jgi:putative serine protease PepD
MPTSGSESFTASSATAGFSGKRGDMPPGARHAAAGRRDGFRSPASLFAAGLAVAVVSAGIGGAVALSVPPTLVGMVAPAPAPAAAATQPVANTPAGSIELVAAKVVPSVVQLETDLGDEVGEGSGIILTADGLIMTNNHVVSPTGDAGPATPGGSRTTVTFADGRSAPFAVVGTDPTSDIAVVRAQGISGLTPITLGTSSNLRVGQQVVAVGSPLGLASTVTSGIISALHRKVSPGGEPTTQTTPFEAIQTDAPMNPGNSGGALVNMSGQLIGVNSAMATLAASAGSPTGSIGLGFAIPVDQAKRVADALIATGKGP